MIAIGMPTIAPITVRLTSTPTMMNTNPTTIATNRPVSPTMVAISRHSAANGHKYHGTRLSVCHVHSLQL